MGLNKDLLDMALCRVKNATQAAAPMYPTPGLQTGGTPVPTTPPVDARSTTSAGGLQSGQTFQAQQWPPQPQPIRVTTSHGAANVPQQGNGPAATAAGLMQSGAGQAQT